MKRILFFACVLFCSYTFAQNRSQNAKSIKESKFLVVIDKKESETSKLIKESMKNYWTFCEYDFIDVTETNAYFNKDGYWMLTACGISQIGYTYGEEYCIAQCKKKNSKDNFTTSNLALLGSSNIEGEKLNYDYMIPYVVNSFNADLEYWFANDGKKRVETHTVVNNTIYVKGAEAKLKKMEILVCKDGLTNEPKVKSVISKKIKVNESQIKLVSSKELLDAVTEKSENTAILVANFVGAFEMFSVSDLEKLASCDQGCRLRDR